jgi:hypothetical protein
MIKIIFSNAQVAMNFNDYLANIFDIKKGVRQGCSMVPYLFLKKSWDKFLNNSLSSKAKW